MACCAMIGQSVINVKSGGRGRLSILVAGIVLIILIVFLGDIVARIPMAALVGVMFMVSIGTFDWNSIRTLRIVPVSDNIVMIVTVVTVLLTHNLAIGVFTGILLSAIFFVSKISKVDVKKEVRTNSVIYEIKGELFFASVTELLESFDYETSDRTNVIIGLGEAHLWDDSAVEALDKIMVKFEEQGKNVELTG